MSAPAERNSSHVASDPAVSAWVSANAGAGKTYTLANRVTRLLLDDARPERILCLTYTKAAAAEMAKRLFDQLGAWSMLKDGDLMKALESIGAGEAVRGNLAKARRLFAQALETPGGLKIQTIHSFCQTLLSRFPVEAGIAPSFDVLDEQTARELMADARVRVLENAAAGDMARASAIRLLITELGEKIFTQILDAALGGDQRKYERAMAGLGAKAADLGVALRQAHGAKSGDTADSIATEFCEAIDKLWLGEIAGLMRNSNKTDKANAEVLFAAIGDAAPVAAFTAYRGYFLTQEGAARKQLIASKIAKDFPQHADHLTDMQARAEDAEDRRRAQHAAQICEAVFSVIDAARTEYAKAKRARGMLDYNDLVSKSVDLLNRKGAAAWVLYKLDGGLDHVLIDEAQDTSPEQWQIVRKLTEEFFAGEGTPGTKPRTIFAVGDEKQSIFSFQGADPAAFEANRDYFKRIVTGAGLKFEDVPLIQSRRSVPEVLEFVDKVFASEEARAGLTLNGDKIEHTAYRKDDRGRVEFLPALKPQAKDDGKAWRRPIGEPAPNGPIAELAKLLAARIAAWVDGNHRLAGRTRAVQAGDIMVLLGRREPFASEIIRQLKALNVPVAGADRITLTEQIAVMDLMALGRFVLLPEDDLNLAALLRSPLGGIGEQELESLCASRGGGVWAELEKRRSETGTFAAAHKLLSDLRARADFMPPYEFYAHVLDANGCHRKMLARLGPEAADAMHEFLSLALAYEAENTPSLEGFLRWIEKGETEIRRDMDSGRNEVRVMTVHGAKGLEADIVIVPDTVSVQGQRGGDDKLLYLDDAILFPVNEKAAPRAVRDARAVLKRKAAEEHRRLLYVALTRARDQLYIGGFETQTKPSPESWYELARAAAEAIGREEDGARIFGEAGFDAFAGSASTTDALECLPEWAATPPKPERARPRYIRPSDAAGLEEPAVESPLNDGAKRFRRGLLVHSMLARLPEIDADKREEIAHQFLKAREIAKTEADALVKETLAVLNDPKFAHAFTKDSRAEVSIVANVPELGEDARTSGRIDRLAVTDGEVLVVDFKTNRPPPARVEDVPPFYVTQMALYRAALEKIFAGKRVSCALVWTEGPSLMALPDSALDAEVERIKAKLAAAP